MSSDDGGDETMSSSSTTRRLRLSAGAFRSIGGAVFRAAGFAETPGRRTAFVGAALRAAGLARAGRRCAAFDALPRRFAAAFFDAAGRGAAFFLAAALRVEVAAAFFLEAAFRVAAGRAAFFFGVFLDALFFAAFGRAAFRLAIAGPLSSGTSKTGPWLGSVTLTVTDK